jgi:hypothetical protein
MGDIAHPFLQECQRVSVRTIPVGAIFRRKGDLTRMYVPQLPRHGHCLQKLLHRYNRQPHMLLRQLLHRKEVHERKGRLDARPVALSEQIHALRRRQNQRPPHGHRQANHGLHGHANVVPAAPVRLEGHILLLQHLVFMKGTDKARVAGNVCGEH